MHQRVREAIALNLSLHPSSRREAQIQARQAEHGRRAALPALRQVLREAHAERAAAQSEADRLTAAVDRAREHRGSVAGRRDEIAQTIAAGDDAAAARLIAELTSGSGRPVDNDLGEGIAVSVALTAAERELAVADRALTQLEEQLAAAQQSLAAANRSVREAVAALLRALARTEAEAILVDADALDRRRAGLDALGIELTQLERQLGLAPRAAWPQSINEALHPELRDPPRLPSRHAGTAPEQSHRWSAVRQALIEDAGAYAELDGLPPSCAEPAPAK
jgi:hypothetical protein